MKIIGRIIALLAGLAFLALVMAWLAGVFTPTEPPGRVAPPAIEIAGTDHVVQAASEPLVERAPGTLRARDETSVSSRITARIVTMHARAGDAVEKGSVLITLDDRDLRARVDQARDQVDAVRARLEEARAAFDRAQSLFRDGAVSRAELDRTEAAFRALDADLARAQRGVEEAEAALSHAIIEAPISGRIVDRYAEPGDIATPGMMLLRLYDPASLRLEADVRESLAADLQRGAVLHAFIDSIGREFETTVEEIVPQSDPGSRSFLVKTALPPGEELYTGMFGRLLIPRGQAEKISIPRTAVQRVGQLEFVYVREDGAAVRRFIRTGSPDGDAVRVVSGLSAGEVVIIPGN